MGFIDAVLSVFLPDPPEIGPDEDPIFVDVRTRREHERQRVAGAKLIPHSQIGTRWPELRKHKSERILVYCTTGSRSKHATRILRSKGFDQAENAGGLWGLKRAGVELE
ncbi:MAG: rhodanese-like domain-containing protein [Longimicrobiales bacterium]